jgi:hypothetical protein
MGRRGPKPRRKSDPEWSAKLAYACGLMASDGCIQSNGRHLNFTSKDLDQIETFKQCMGLENTIHRKHNGSGTESLQVQWSDVTLYKWFIKIGITPRKTFTIGEIKVPDQYVFDFLRGEFDGDGTSHAYWDTRWRSSVSLYISFVCASRSHLEWLNAKILQLSNTNGLIRQYGKGIPYLIFSKAKARVLYEHMYYTPVIPYLRRKKEKLDRQWAALAMARQGNPPLVTQRGGQILKIA